MADLRCEHCGLWWKSRGDLAKHQWLAHGVEIPKGEDVAMTTDLVEAPCGAKVRAGSALGGHKGHCRSCQRIKTEGRQDGVDDSPPFPRGRRPAKKPTPKRKPGRRRRATVAVRSPTYVGDPIQGAIVQLEAMVEAGKAAEVALVAIRKLA